MRYNKNTVKGKILVTMLHNDKNMTEKLFPIVESSLTVNGITFPIQTHNAFKMVEVNGGCYIPSVTLHNDKILSHKRETCGTAITDDNLFMRFFAIPQQKHGGSNNQPEHKGEKE